MDLVVGIQDGRIRVAAHAGGTHFVDRHTGVRTRIVRLHVFQARRFEHFGGVVSHIHAHFPFVFLEFSVEHDERQAPFVLVGLVEVHPVFVVGQRFTKGN